MEHGSLEDKPSDDMNDNDELEIRPGTDGGGQDHFHGEQHLPGWADAEDLTAIINGVPMKGVNIKSTVQPFLDIDDDQYSELELKFPEQVNPRETERNGVLSVLCRIILEERRIGDTANLEECICKLSISHDSSGLPIAQYENGRNKNVWDIAKWFESYHFEGEFSPFMDLINTLNIFHIKRVLISVFSEQIVRYITETGCPLPAIIHSSRGMHEAAYISYMELMLGDHCNGSGAKTDWAVLFHERGEVDLSNITDEIILDSIQGKIKGLSSSITKVFIVLKVKLGQDLDYDKHVLCVLYSRVRADKHFVTALDELWTHDMYINTNIYSNYIMLLSEIATCIDMSKTEIVLSAHACKWLSANPHTLQGLELRITNHESLGMDWLSIMLTKPIKIGETHSNALVCPFVASLYLLNGITENFINTKEWMQIEVNHAHDVISPINHALSACVLSGCFILSSTLIRNILNKMGNNDDPFHMVDAIEHRPCNIYAWAISHDEDSGTAIYSLQYDDMLEHFGWHRYRYDHTGPKDSVRLLQILSSDSVRDARNIALHEQQSEDPDDSMQDARNIALHERQSEDPERDPDRGTRKRGMGDMDYQYTYSRENVRRRPGTGAQLIAVKRVLEIMLLH
jgi:hypothetical protein